jgi:hypothetical protein
MRFLQATVYGWKERFTVYNASCKKISVFETLYLTCTHAVWELCYLFPLSPIFIVNKNERAHGKPASFPFSFNELNLKTAFWYDFMKLSWWYFSVWPALFLVIFSENITCAAWIERRDINIIHYTLGIHWGRKCSSYIEKGGRFG